MTSISKELISQNSTHYHCLTDLHHTLWYSDNLIAHSLTWVSDYCFDNTNLNYCLKCSRGLYSGVHAFVGFVNTLFDILISPESQPNQNNYNVHFYSKITIATKVHFQFRFHSDNIIRSYLCTIFALRNNYWIYFIFSRVTI